MWGKNKNVDETESADKKFQKELVSGVAALVLLTILDKAAEPMYGYQIAKVIDGQADEAAVLKQGALYPVLRSLESSGLLESRVEPSVSGPPRRYYRITESGHNTLARWREMWDQMRSFVDTVMKGEGNGEER
ncbi:MAG: PadR family transcriptional regulator [Dehalococcoidia bacterium]|nr:PadR family transcriptional regulator [Dehalococcoidia bacterium]